MRTTGIVLIVLGALSLLGALIAAAKGQQTSFAGLTFIVIGAFLISRVEKKKEEVEQRRKWEEGSTDKD